jgi:ethanolamine ammonia-lyase small subunit
MSEPLASDDPWHPLRELTPARIALGSVGASLPTVRQLEFQLAHARARDAVHLPLDVAALEVELAATGVALVRARSAAPDRGVYLARPDLGRRLDDPSRAALAALGGDCDAAFVVADGLSASAVHRHAGPTLARAVASLVDDGWRVGPIVVVEQGRVAIGDEIGALLGASLVAVLLGERPGLSSPDSMGIYLTHAPRPGRTDAERNCISNVRPAGLPPGAAADRLVWLMREARRRRVTGIALRDEAPRTVAASTLRSLDAGD